MSTRNLKIILAALFLGILSRNRFVFIIFLPLLLYYTGRRVFVVFVFFCGFIIPPRPIKLHEEVGQVVYINQNRAYLSNLGKSNWVFHNKSLKLGHSYSFKISKNRRIYRKKLLSKHSLSLLAKLRIKISKKLKNYPLFLAFFLGDNSSICPKVTRRIQEQGIWSAFLTSSIQINCVFNLLLFIFSRIFSLHSGLNYKLPRRKIINFFVIFLSCLYYLITLGGYGSLRVLFVRSLSLFFPNQKRRMSIIFALVTILVNPGVIFDYGFQLSSCLSFLASEGLYCDPITALWFGKFSPFGFIYFTLMRWLAPVIFLVSFILILGLRWKIFNKFHSLLMYFFSLPNPFLIKLPIKILLFPSFLFLMRHFFQRKGENIYFLYGLMFFVTIIQNIV